jgi:hypothetical protein
MTHAASTQRRVPFNVLAPGVASIRAEVDQAIARVLDRGWFLSGPEQESFEREFAAYHAPDQQTGAVSSGTDALRIGLQALGIGSGDDVLVTANAGVPPVAAVVAAGARPVFCDIDPRTHTLDPAEIDRRIGALDLESAAAAARREIVVSAPEDGVVTAIQTESGGGVNTSVPLLSIIPSGSKLKAQLFAPSRVVGFLRPGQRVLLRYEAFPYQKFGQYEGTVTSVSRSATSPSLLSQQVSGLTSLFGSNAPVYEINVALARQSVMAYGKPVPLQPGMQLEADVLIEKRRLIEWVLDPIFTLTGKWHW